MTSNISLAAPAPDARGLPAKSAAQEKTMDLAKFASAKFLKLEDLVKAGRPLLKTIESVAEGNYDKPVLRFTDGTRLSLNATNVSSIIELFGSTESDDLIKQDIELYVGVTKYRGADQDSVLVRKPTPRGSRKAEFGDEIPF
jgi:hypothetical protein